MEVVLNGSQNNELRESCRDLVEGYREVAFCLFCDGFDEDR